MNIMDIFESKRKPKNGIQLDSVYDFNVTDFNGNDVPMLDYKAKVLLIVNVSSRNPEALSIFKKLYTINGCFRHRGLKILAFPCGQFGESETRQGVVDFLQDNNMEIGEIFAPVHVNGSNAAPLFTYLKKKCPGRHGQFINANFTMFIIDENGQPLERLIPPITIDTLKDIVDITLKEKDRYRTLSTNATSVINVIT